MFAQICGKSKPDVIRTNGKLAMIAIDECCNSESLQVSIQQEARGINECFSTIENIVNEHDVIIAAVVIDGIRLIDNMQFSTV